MSESLKNPSGNPAASACVRPGRGPHSDYFPNVVLRTHENIKVRFYDDLLRDKSVLINLFSVQEDARFRITENLVKVQELLGDQLGANVFIYSITTDPRRDTARALADFADNYDVRRGWLFLTGDESDVGLVRSRLYASRAGHDHQAGSVEDCSLTLIRYGNEAAGVWGSVPGVSRPEAIAERMSWVRNRDVPPGPPKRRGPTPLQVQRFLR